MWWRYGCGNERLLSFWDIYVNLHNSSVGIIVTNDFFSLRYDKDIIKLLISKSIPNRKIKSLCKSEAIDLGSIQILLLGLQFRLPLWGRLPKWFCEPLHLSLSKVYLYSRGWNLLISLFLFHLRIVVVQFAFFVVFIVLPETATTSQFLFHICNHFVS